MYNAPFRMLPLTAVREDSRSHNWAVGMWMNMDRDRIAADDNDEQSYCFAHIIQYGSRHPLFLYGAHKF